jgi:hypothetical protein
MLRVPGMPCGDTISGEFYWRKPVAAALVPAFLEWPFFDRPFFDGFVGAIAGGELQQTLPCGDCNRLANPCTPHRLQRASGGLCYFTCDFGNAKRTTEPGGPLATGGRRLTHL